MTSVPRVSVVLPTYNRAHLLSRTLQTVLAQTFRDFEVWVVDDGSTDHTERVVAGHADPRLHFARVDHRGAAAARNYGVRQARGEWVAFIDSDDEWMPDKLERQMRAAETAPPEVGVIYTGGTIVDDATGRMIGARRVRPGGNGRIFDLLLEAHWFSLISIAARRRCFEDVGDFDEHLGFGEDRDWLLRAARRYEFLGVDAPLVRVHIHSGARLTGNLVARTEFVERVLDRYAAELRARPALAARKHVGLGQLFLRLGDMTRARKAFRDAIAVYPAFVPAYAHLALSWGPWRAWHALGRWRQRRRGARAAAHLSQREGAA